MKRPNSDPELPDFMPTQSPTRREVLHSEHNTAAIGPQARANQPTGTIAGEENPDLEKLQELLAWEPGSVR